MRIALAAAIALIAILPTSQSAYATATSSTADNDVYGIYAPGPLPPCRPNLHMTLVDNLEDCGLVMVCPADLFIRNVTLRLLDPSPGDVVALTIVGETPAISPVFSPSNPPLYPTELATYNDPVAEIPVSLGGCNRTANAVVTGILVEGEVSYEITY